MASASPRPDGCNPQSHCGKGWVLAFTTPYKSYCWERPKIIPNERLSFILLYLPTVHARYHEGVMTSAGVKNILGPYRDCSYSTCFPRENKCFTHFLGGNAPPVSIKQPPETDSHYFSLYNQLLGRMEGIWRDSCFQPPAPRQCQLYFWEALILKLSTAKASLPTFAFSNVKPKLPLLKSRPITPCISYQGHGKQIILSYSNFRGVSRPLCFLFFLFLSRSSNFSCLSSYIMLSRLLLMHIKYLS